MSFFSEIFQDLSKIPGSPEAVTSAVEGGLNGSLSWNPFSKSNSVWDTGAGGTQLSQNPTDRAIGRTIGSYFAGGALGGALGGSGTTAADASGWTQAGAQAATDADSASTINFGANTAADAGGWSAAGADAAAGLDAANTINFAGNGLSDAGSLGTNFTTADAGYGSLSDAASGVTTPTGSGTLNDPGSPIPDVNQIQNPTDALNSQAANTPQLGQNPNSPSWLKSALSAMGNNKLQTAQLGLGTLGLINQVKQGSSAQKQMNAIAGPASQASQQLLAQFKAGQINPSDAYAIQQWQQTQQAQSDQYFAQAGLSNSSMHQQASSQIAAQAEAMRQQAVQNLLTQGLSAAGVANPTLQAGVQAGMQQDNAAMTAMNNFLATLAKMNTGGGSGGGSNTQTQTGTPNG